MTSEAKAAAAEPIDRPSLEDVLGEMKAAYGANPTKAVRSQGFIKTLHRHIADDLRGRLTDTAKRAGVQVMEEPKIFGSHKPKDADVALIHPTNGLLMYVGVRSQMSSIGQNVLEYYQGITGECISLQDRFPMATFGYVYLHPVLSKKSATIGGKKVLVDEFPDHPRYARMYEAITGRRGLQYKEIRGIYDQFAYMVVEFRNDPLPEIKDDVVQTAVPLERTDLRISTFVDRMVATFKERNLWLDYFV